ncbi:MAG: 1-deoxy-D-xylulose-5-phosphate synthase [bacterium]
MNEILSKIESPKDLKSLSIDELKLLARETRKRILDTISKTGGHLSSSLGTVELTIALHYVFNSPIDKIIWDVGHQAYAHKIITGRNNQFSTIRKFGGLNGFPKREESIYDSFNTGHSSTSISAALGMAVARDLNKDNFKLIAVIGDGALTGGMAFEGLNQAGHLKKDIIVILNDNSMSISKNVGGIALYLNRIITGQFYRRLKTDLEILIRSIPQIGNQVLKVASRIDEAIKSIIVPGVLFEELGFKYFGPIEGHNISNLVETLHAIKDLNKPILLHIITKKGKGYEPAEINSSSFHSAPPFEISSGKFIKKHSAMTYTEAFSHSLCKLAKNNKKIIGITAAMREGTGLDQFADLYPERFFDVGIAEEHAVTFAAGMCTEGLRPVVAIYSTFLQRAYDQIEHDVCIQKLPVIFALDRAGIVGEDGATHAGIFDLSYLRSLPHMAIMAPKDENELAHMFHTALCNEKPTAIRYPRGPAEGVEMDEDLKMLEWGKGEIVREGKDILVLAVGPMVYETVRAAKKLGNDGISTAIINPRFIKPLDSELICDMSSQIKQIITIEDNTLCGGFGSAILELLQEKGILPSVRIIRIGIPDQFVNVGSIPQIRHQYNLDAEGIINVIYNLVKLDRINLPEKTPLYFKTSKHY